MTHIVYCVLQSRDGLLRLPEATPLPLPCAGDPCDHLDSAAPGGDREQWQQQRLPLHAGPHGGGAGGGGGLGAGDQDGEVEPVHHPRGQSPSVQRALGEKIKFANHIDQNLKTLPSQVFFVKES